MLPQPQCRYSVSSAERDALLNKAVALFNAHEWYASHDAFEFLWRAEKAPTRVVFKAFVQISAGLYHAENGNMRGAVRLLSRADALLAAYLPQDGLVEASDSCIQVGLLLAPVGRWLRNLVQHQPQDGVMLLLSPAYSTMIPVLDVCGR